VSRYDASLNLISVLDLLRDAYDLAKEAGHTRLQDRLMAARRHLMEAVHQSLNLHSELAEVQEQLAQAREEGSKQESTARVLRPIPDPLPRRVS
jgi:predicted  nucleic acid-binding Zn-ribbon protein